MTPSTRKQEQQVLELIKGYIVYPATLEETIESKGHIQTEKVNKQQPKYNYRLL